MRRNALAHVLRDFSPAEEVSPVKVDAGARVAPEATLSQVAAAQAASEAYSSGIVDGRLEVLAEVEQRMQVVRAEVEDMLERERAQWADEVAESLAGKLEESVQLLEQEISEAVRRCLIPIVREFANGEALNQLLADIDRALSVQENVTLSMEGPERLLMALSKRLDDKGIAYRLVPSTGVDLSVQVGSAVIATRLAEVLEPLEDH